MRVPLTAGLFDPSIDDNHVAFVNDGNGCTLVVDFDAGERLLGENEHRRIGDFLEATWDRYATFVIEPTEEYKFWIKLHRGMGIGSVKSKITPMGIRIHANHLLSALGITMPSVGSEKFPAYWDDNVYGVMVDLEAIKAHKELKEKFVTSVSLEQLAAEREEARLARREKDKADSPDAWPYPYEEIRTSRSGPLSIVIVVDASGSMRREFPGTSSYMMDILKDRIIKAVMAAPDYTDIGLLSFHDKGWVELEPTANRDVFRSKIETLSADGPTLMNEALQSARKMLTLHAKVRQGLGDYEIIVITDGVVDFVDKILREIQTMTPIGVRALSLGARQKDILRLPSGMACLPIENPNELDEALDILFKG